MALSTPPIAAWLFDEEAGTTAAEYFGTTALDITLVNDPTLGTSGLDFSGETDDYATIADGDNDDLRLTAPFSIAIGVQTGSTTTNQQFFHSNDRSGNYAGYNLITNGSSVLEFMYGDNGGSGYTERRSFTGPTLSANTFYNIVINVLSTGGTASGVEIHIDAVSQTVTASGGGGAMVYSDDPTIIGRWLAWGLDSSHICRYLFIYDHVLAQYEIVAVDDDYTVAVDEFEIPAPETPIEIATSSYFDHPMGMLSYPRWKIAVDPDESEKITLIVGSSGTVADAYTSDDLGNTWTALGSSQSWDYHASLNRGSDGVLHVGSRDGQNGIAKYQRYTTAWQTQITFDDYTAEEGTANAISYDGDVFVVVRSSFGSSPYTIFWHQSTDNGATFGSANTLVQPTSNTWHRIGSLYLDGYPAFMVWDTEATYCTIRLYRWNGTSFAAVANNDLQTNSTSTYTRQFSICETADGTIHAVWWDELSGPTYVIRHSYRTLAGTWSTPTTIMTSVSTPIADPILTSHNNVPHLIYTENTGTYDEVRFRSFSSSTWSSPTTVSTTGDGDCSDASTAPIIPASFSYIPVGYTQDGSVTDTLKYAAISVTPIPIPTKLPHGGKYQVVWNGSEWVITWTDDTALQADDIIQIGVNPATTATTETSISGAVVDGFSFADSATKRAVFSAIAQETISLADTDQNIGAFISAIAEQLRLSDQVSKAATFPVASADSFSISDSASTLQKIIGLVSEDIAVSDIAASRGDFQGIAQDALSFSDSIINALQAKAVVDEIINLSDTSSTEALSLISALVADTIHFSDNSTSRADLVVAILDNLNLSDSAISFLSTLAIAQDELSFSDTVFWQGIQTAFATDNLNVSDQAATIFQTFAGAADSIQFTDSSTVTATFNATASDMVQFAEVISNIAAFRASVADGIRVTATPMEVSQLPNGKVSISFSVKVPGVGFEMKTATIVFNIK